MTSAPSYLDELDQLLLDQSDDCMVLTQLDGFLTGVVVSPKLLRPTDWLKHIWCGDDGVGMPEFDSTSDFQHFLDLIMRHYNAVLGALDRPGEYEPVFDIDTRNGDVLWEMWVDGFARSVSLATESWSQIAASDDVGCQAARTGIQTLIDFAEGKKKLSRQEEEKWNREAPDLIPMWIEMLHAWRLEKDPNRPRSVQRNKVGRNDPCPCGSGKKYKKCCGLN